MEHNPEHKNMTVGLKDGKLVHIEDVERGLKCGCICPACEGQLIANKGSKKAWYFSHRNSKDCIYGYQTSLHLLAKEVLEKTKVLTIPPTYCALGKINDWTTIHFDKVYTEKSEGSFIPDVTVELDGKKLFVEIYVTH